MNLKEKYKNDPEYRERRKKYALEYQKKNKDKVNAQKRKYYATSKGKASILRAQRRYRLKRACLARSIVPGDSLGDSSKPMPEGVSTAELQDPGGKSG